MNRLKIGISACFMHKDPTRAIFKGKTLLYNEESLVHWAMRLGAMPLMVPSVVEGEGRVSLADYAYALDGLILHGGSDVAPEAYGEAPMKPEWKGDRVRDLYEIELFHEFKKLGKPILGVCRGAQVINVALGGSLYQDIETQVPDALNHRDWQRYDQNFHEIDIAPQSYLARLYGEGKFKTNTIHHQALKTMGTNLVIEATSSEDGIVEAFKLKEPTYVCGIQWHPEFHDEADRSLLSGDPLLKDFLSECEIFKMNQKMDRAKK
ncbi:MAG TPA: gamma-glutamyl-gamma-aminobutyrate hydrolase family protein [Turneriella sp.]|nr:gamma-glutamyl-gamma-aminobutyrate hydrolase family protein [Turneriella sp.]